MIEFTSPAMLWALAAVSIPLIIHLLSRRYRRAPWAAMAFLVRAERSTRRRLIWQHLLVLALRVLAVALLVVLFARPFLPRGMGVLGALGEGGASLVVLLDDSASMSQRDGDQTAFERARELLAGMARKLAPARGGARHTAGPVGLTVYLASRSEAVFHSDRLQADEVEQFRAVLDELHPAAVSLMVEAQLAELAARTESVGTKDVTFLVLTDLRACDWDREPAMAALRRLQEHGRVVLVDGGPEDVANVGIPAAQCAEPIVYAGVPTRCQVRIENNSPADLPGSRLEVLVDGRNLAPVPTPPLPSGAAVQVPVALRLEEGYHGLEFRFDSTDTFPADDRAYLAVKSRRSVRLLVIEGAPGLRESDGSAYYLRAALDPREQPEAGFDVDVRTPWSLAELPLSDYAVVFLCNVAEPGERASAALRRYVELGGGLVMFLGGRTATESWNATLLDPAKGVLPARLAQSLAPAEAAHLAGMDFSDPLLAPFVGWQALFTGFGVTGYWQVEPLGETQVLARLHDEGGPPALLRHRTGNGTALLITTSADDEWNDWARGETGRITYVALVQRAAELLASGQQEPLNLEGGPGGFQVRLDPGDHEKRATLLGPGGEVVHLSAEPDEEGGGLWLNGPPADHAGLWRVELKRRDGGTETLRFAVNMPARERELERVSAEALQAAALSPESLQVLRFDERPLADLEAGRRSYWQLAVAGLLLVLLMESGLAWLFGNPRGAATPTRGAR